MEHGGNTRQGGAKLDGEGTFPGFLSDELAFTKKLSRGKIVFQGTETSISVG